jgi:molecular chaperone GrpE
MSDTQTQEYSRLNPESTTISEAEVSQGENGTVFVSDFKEIEDFIEQNRTLMNQMSDRLSNSMSVLQRDFETKIKYDQSKDGTIDALHRELQTYREDLAFKFLRPLALDLTRLTDRMRSLASKYKKTDQSVEAGNFIEDLDDFILDIQEAISLHGFEFFQVEDEVFDRSRQKAQKVINTDNQEQDKHIAERMQVGLRYEERVVRPELVSVYRYIDREKEQT